MRSISSPASCLSPYNVYLYNSPLQALMACAIAVYGDDPRGDAIPAFTADPRINRVLLVWRQIMGKNTGNQSTESAEQYIDRPHAMAR